MTLIGYCDDVYDDDDDDDDGDGCSDPQTVKEVGVSTSLV
jgi:hypothetical protein